MRDTPIFSPNEHCAQESYGEVSERWDSLKKKLEDRVAGLFVTLFFYG